MKRLLTMTTALALVATTALAENYPTDIGEPVYIEKDCCENPSPEPKSSSNNGGAIVAVVAAFAAIAFVAHSRKQSDPNAPRRPVEPEPDYNKILELVN